MGAKRYADAVRAFTDCREAFSCLAAATAVDRADTEKRIDGAIRELRDVLGQVEREQMMIGSIPGREVNGVPPGNPGHAALQEDRRHPPGAGALAAPARSGGHSRRD